MKIITVGQLIDGLKHYDSESEITILDNHNGNQYDIYFVLEDEKENSQVMIAY